MVVAYLRLHLGNILLDFLQVVSIRTTLSTKEELLQVVLQVLETIQCLIYIFERNAHLDLNDGHFSHVNSSPKNKSFR